MYPWQAWYRPSWPLIQRSTCPCLWRTGPKGCSTTFLNRQNVYTHLVYTLCIYILYVYVCIHSVYVYILSFEVYIYIKFFSIFDFLCKNSFSIAKLYKISILECLRIILIVSHPPPRFLWQGFFVCSPGDFSRFDKSVCDSYSLEIGFLCLQLLLFWNSWWLLSTAKYKST